MYHSTQQFQTVESASTGACRGPWLYNRMTVVRTGTADDVTVYSPIALSPALKDRVDVLGTVTHVVAPNTWHNLFASQWHDAYPAASFVCPADLAAKRPDVAWDCTMDAGGVNHIGAVTLYALPSLCRGMAEIVLFDTASGTLVGADLLYANSTHRRFAFDRPPHVPVDEDHVAFAEASDSYRQLFDVVFCQSTSVLAPLVPKPRLPMYRHVIA